MPRRSVLWSTTSMIIAILRVKKWPHMIGKIGPIQNYQEGSQDFIINDSFGVLGVI